MKKLYFVFTLLVFGFGFGQNLNPADLDSTFNLDNDKTMINGYINHSLLQSDGKIVLFGEFTGAQKISGEIIRSRNIIRLNSDMSLDDSFNPGGAGINGNITAVAVQSDNKMIVSGNIISVNEVVLGVGGGSSIISFRLNANGTYDNTFSNFNFDSFTSYYNTKLEIQSDDKILVTNTQSSLPQTHRVNSNGTMDWNLQTIYGTYTNSPNGKKYLVDVVYSDQILSRLYRINDNGLPDTQFNDDTNSLNNVFIINSASSKKEIKILPDNKILVYGNFDGVVGSSTNSKKIIRINSDGKTLDTTFSSEQLNLNDPDNVNVVSEIINLPNGKLIVVVNYRQPFVPGDAVFGYRYITKIMRLNSNGSIDTAFNEGSFGILRDFNPINILKKPKIGLLSNDKILVFKDALDEPYINGVYRLLYNGFSCQDNYFIIGSDGNLFYKPVRDQNIYTKTLIKDSNNNICLVGQSFVNELYHRGINLLNSDGFPILNDNLKIGFTPFPNGYNENYDLDNCHIAIKQSDGKLLVGGRFTAYNGQLSNRLIRLNADYSKDVTFNIGTGVAGTGYNEDYYYVDKIAQQPDGKILISGNLGNLFNGIPISSNIIRLNSDGSIDTSFNYFADLVYKVLVQPDGKILINTNLTGGLIRLNSDCSIDSTFNSNGVSGNFLLHSDGKITVFFNGTFKRLDSNGNLEFTSPYNNLIYGDPYLQPDGKFIIKYLNSLSRINSNGTTDTSFNTGSGFNSNIRDVFIEEDGNILVAGDFTRYNGAWCNRIVRLLGGNGYVIQGEIRFDQNGNGCDNNDLFGKLIKLKVNNGINNFDIIANTTGNYFIPTNSGNYTITPTFENPSYFNVSPPSISVSFPSQASPVIQNFCITANGLHPDLEVTLLPLTVARPGFLTKYKLVYKNKGNQSQSGILNFNFNDDVLNFMSATTAVSSQTLNNLNWSFSNLMPFETREITITLFLNTPTSTPPVNSGFLLNYITTVSSSLTDEMPNDNTFTYSQTVVNSFDPNDKTCLEGATIATTKVGDYVHYMIRFENTGSYNAQNITVKDVIDTSKYDISTLVPTSGSNLFVTRILEGNRAEFYFENINLPFDDANNDGYVAFKIKTKSTLVAGDSFSNSAGIYFDYNYPITTNTATTTITALSNQDFTFNDYFSVYPNPVENNLNISKKEEIEILSITIYNIIGQIVVAIPNAKNIETVDVSLLKSGNYFVKINSDKGTSNAKFIKL